MIEMKTIHFVPKIEYMESDELITLNAMGTKFTIKASLLKTSKIDEGSRLAMLRNYTTLTSQEILKCCDWVRSSCDGVLFHAGSRRSKVGSQLFDYRGAAYEDESV